MKPTMTVREVTEDLRKCGVSISEVAVREFIKRGEYPFGKACKTSSKWSFQIFRLPFENWKREMGLGYIIKKGIHDDAVLEFEKAKRSLKNVDIYRKGVH